MELIFIRHGQGEHTLAIPNSLQVKNPSLTALGISQAKLLRKKFTLTDEDIVFISPLKRTLETAQIWTLHVDCRKIVSPLVSPRIFPFRENGKTLPCDKIINLETIKKDYPNLEIHMNVLPDLWLGGINTMSDSDFNNIAQQFIANLKLLKKDRIFIVSHDGTITSYRQLISGRTLSRSDFPDETGSFQINID
ncbi:histidine phosphatase family protein [Lysinibacillus xylanilyticus]|uniref:Histidine phosphatase family protein n=1 Tax=Lysinibacillus xylanilyticus TaxID=582475 RepID=A0A2M9Q9H5_9BACI|nr:histidine phosphatase family protein [Lysinibacillus xylanilyticus]PJO44721.1 histidine phosphatase family protein [Lysinibacillus xylanilyticus]